MSGLIPIHQSNWPTFGSLTFNPSDTFAYIADNYYARPLIRVVNLVSNSTVNTMGINDTYATFQAYVSITGMAISHSGTFALVSESNSRGNGVVVRIPTTP